MDQLIHLRCPMQTVMCIRRNHLYNPVIHHPIGDILFDEKIAGSFHLTPGNSYDNASNGNHSAVHWDLIQIQTPEYGGGEIWFDDVLIRKDGRFLPEELQCLNPENLLSEEQEDA